MTRELSLPRVVIIELGSQFTLLIERTLRELGVRSAILSPQRAAEWFNQNTPKAVILSGGASSVYDSDAPQPPKEILSLCQKHGQPVAILGICYGMQWLAQVFGGEVKPMAGNREYGEAMIDLLEVNLTLFEGTPSKQPVWMSHGDSVTVLPEGFTALAQTNTGTIAAMRKDSIWGVQFHPEVTHSIFGKEVLGNFLRLAGCQKDWVPSSIISAIQDEIVEGVGWGKAIIGESGGVDSTVLAAIAAPVLDDRLLAITIDGGQLREGELDEIRENAYSAGVSLKVINAHSEFATAMRGVTDAEKKRHRFKEVYPSIFIREAILFGAPVALQGTLAPDRIESGATGGRNIKSHHNVGLKMGHLTQLHPFGHLFKYEIRALAKEVGLPERVCKRQPFPGPGLFIRVVGVPATPKKLNIVRWADNQVQLILLHHGLYDQVSQLVVAYIGIDTVGVKGDARVYGGSIVVRAVETLDFMTSSAVHFPDEVEDEITSVLTRHPEVVRVWFDFTRKPPATTEME